MRRKSCQRLQQSAESPDLLADSRPGAVPRHPGPAGWPLSLAEQGPLSCHFSPPVPALCSMFNRYWQVHEQLPSRWIPPAGARSANITFIKASDTYVCCHFVWHAKRSAPTRLLFSAPVIVVVDHRQLGALQNQQSKEISASKPGHSSTVRPPLSTLQGKRLAADTQLSVCWSLIWW